MCAAVSRSRSAADFGRSRRPDLKSPVVAVVGATGAVGVEMVECLQRRKFPLKSLRLFASARSAGQRVAFDGASIVIEELREDALDGIEFDRRL
jgi:aspartate-semialdehyde dehydrogenase